jgi:hypothetical protein
MPVIYTIDRTERVVYLTTAGEPSFSEWRDTLLKLFSDPDFETGFHFISDRRQSTEPSREFVERQTAFLREHERELGRCRWAAVVPDPATDRAVRAIAERAGLADLEVGFFYNLAAARRWIFARD